MQLNWRFLFQNYQCKTINDAFLWPVLKRTHLTFHLLSQSCTNQPSYPSHQHWWKPRFSYQHIELFLLMWSFGTDSKIFLFWYCSSSNWRAFIFIFLLFEVIYVGARVILGGFFLLFLMWKSWCGWFGRVFIGLEWLVWRVIIRYSSTDFFPILFGFDRFRFDFQWFQIPRTNNFLINRTTIILFL